jgi:hypothetical protein
MAQHLRILDTVRLSPPASALPAAPLPLSGLDTDRNVLDVAFRTLRFFPPPDPASPLDPLGVLPRAFEAALTWFPALAGSLRADDSQVVVSDASAVLLVLAKSDLFVKDVDADSPGSPLLDLLAPRDGDRSGPVLALQATRFACGGVGLGMRVAHALCDGAGATAFLAAAARFARGQGPPAVAPVWERRDLLGPRRPPLVVATLFDRVLALDDGVTRNGPYSSAKDGRGQQQRQLTRECFHVSDARVEALRARLADEAGIKFTSFEVVAAFIWRAR